MNRVNVTVSDPFLTRIEAVARNLAAAGMRVDQVLPTTGIITGSVPIHLQPGLGLVDGVSAVEPDTGVQLPPPDSEIQ